MSDASRWNALSRRLGPRASLLEQVGLAAADCNVRAAVVGGAVRDFLIGREVGDLDIVVEGDATEVGRELRHRHGGDLVQHAPFMTATWMTPLGSVDLSSARRESYACPGALPEVVHAELTEDLARRDFTINTLAILVDASDRGRLVDPHDGVSDLESGLIRVLHPESFRDDPTRVWRACRYAGRFDFELTSSTAALVEKLWLEEGMHTISLQRVANELDKVFLEERVVPVLSRLLQYKVLQSIDVACTLDSGMMQRVVNGAARYPEWNSATQEAFWLLLARGLGRHQRAVLVDLASGKQGRTGRWLHGPETLARAEETLGEVQDYARWGAYFSKRTPVEFLVLHALNDAWHPALHWWMDTGRHLKTAVTAEAMLARDVPQGPLIGQGLAAAQRLAWQGESEAEQWRVALMPTISTSAKRPKEGYE